MPVCRSSPGTMWAARLGSSASRAPNLKSTRSERLIVDLVTETKPLTYALRCADHERLIGQDSKVNEYKRPQVKGTPTTTGAIPYP